MARYTPDMQIQYCCDEDRCFFGNAPTIGLVKAAYGRNIAESWIEIQLNDLSEFAGCREKMRPRQTAELAAMILQDYPHYKLTELMLFFQRFKRCEYGKFFGAVDPMVIIQALGTFDVDRLRRYDQRDLDLEFARAEQESQRLEAMQRRYAQHVPYAFTDKAPIDFLQYRLMGYNKMSDEQLAKELEELQSGRKIIPDNVRQILAMIQDNEE